MNEILNLKNKTLKITLLKLYVTVIFKVTGLAGGKGYGFLSRIARKYLGEQIVCGDINASSVFCFNLLDDYWNKLIVSEAIYEPEIYIALEKLKNEMLSLNMTAVFSAVRYQNSL